ncbi:hypothetical protein [Celeribacter halophilus]
MAQFLFNSGVLRGADGQPLAWSGDVSGWFDQSWMTTDDAGAECCSSA